MATKNINGSKFGIGTTEQEDMVLFGVIARHIEQEDIHRVWTAFVSKGKSLTLTQYQALLLADPEARLDFVPENRHGVSDIRYMMQFGPAKAKRRSGPFQQACSLAGISLTEHMKSILAPLRDNGKPASGNAARIAELEAKIKELEDHI